MAADNTDDFQKELIVHFVQEAHEWLQRIHDALDELQQGPAPERHAELIHTMSAGVTSLGGSAATIDLPDVTQASFAALPFIESLQDPLSAGSAQGFLSLCKQLGQIHTALTQATGVSFDDDGSGAAAETVDVGLSPEKFLQRLQELQNKQPSDAGSGHNVIRSLIEQMEGNIQAGVTRIDPTTVHGYLVQVSEAEESFLRAIDEQVPEIMKKMRLLKMAGGEPSTHMVALEASLQNVAKLRTEAQQVNAGSAMMFFTGLHVLLTMVTEGRVLLAATRVESVTSRLHMMGDAIRLWVEHGRAQRAAIDQALSTQGQGV
jgi:HPt (histidine-containing phosphotransfer) domain-containing protein